MSLDPGFECVAYEIPLASLQAFCRTTGHAACQTLTCPPGSSDPVLHGLSRALANSANESSSSDITFVDHLVLAVLVHVVQTYGGLYFPSRNKGRLSSRQERLAIEWLAEHYGARVSIASLATRCGLSQGYFNRAFRQSFGCTPTRWITDYRLARARELLLLKVPIAEIAVRCGFSDQSHFTRTFSTATGYPPSRYREQLPESFGGGTGVPWPK